MALNTSSVAPLLVEGIRKLVGDQFRRRPLEMAQYANMLTSRKNFEFDREVAEVGPLAPKSENAPVTLFDPRVGRQKTYSFVTYAGGIRVSWEAESDELYGFIRRALGSLGRAANETMNIVGADLFNLADSGDSNPITGFDTLALLHDTHTGPNGETITYNDNRLAFDLSESYLQTLLIQFEKIADPSGNLLNFDAKNILFHPDNMFLLQEILKSEGKPFTADNTLNVLRGKLTPVMLHYATDSDRTIVSASENDLNFWTRSAPTVSNYDDNSTKSMVTDVTMRIGRGFGYWQSVIGSPGV